MDVLKQQVRRARRRLTVQRFLRVLSWCWFAALLMAAALVAVDKYHSLGLLTWAWPAIALSAGLVVALAWCLFTRRSELEAALEIDRRFGLKERISSTFALSPEQMETPAARALIDDAVKRVERLHVGDQFRVRLGRWAWLPIAPAAAVFLLAVFLNPAINEQKAGGSVPSLAEKKRIKTSTEAMRRKLIERRKDAREKDLKEAEELFAKLEQGAKQLTKADMNDRKQALVELNDLAKDIEKRKQQLGGGDKLQEQLKNLKNIEKGPGDKLADAMRQGDLNQALKELKQLREKLDKGAFDAQSKADLQKQLKQMEEKIRKVADAHKKMEQDLKKQIAEKKSKGQHNEAKQLEQQLAKLQQSKPQMQQMKKMADQLGQCSKCMQQGDKAGAMASMKQLEQQLSELQQQADELAMLDDALSELDMAKDSMNCQECGGEGCAACMGLGKKYGRGMGLGKGRGQGARPEEKTGTGFYDTKVKQQTGKGAALVVDLVDGPNMKGQVQQEIQTEFQSVKAGETDPLTSQQLPRAYREHSLKYFDSFREGKK